MSKAIHQASQRLSSLDFLRGLIMVLLMMESTGLYGYLEENTKGSIFNLLTIQFVHHPWNGLRFWDLVQPAFMFMAGTAMALSLHKQWANGVSWNVSFKKILRRCGWLFFWGVLDYAVRPTGLSFELWDVLTQLSFTTLIAFLIFKWDYKYQILFCFFLLVLTECLYRLTAIPNFNDPFSDQHNFGNYMDLILMNKINTDGWVAINCVPTAVHTIAGAMVGKMVVQKSNILQRLFMWSVVCLTVGYGLNAMGITPIIKRIATSSFTIASLGWCLLFLALCYWWIDIKNHTRFTLFFKIVGMNSIFIYIFFEIVGSRWFNGYISDISNGILNLMHASEPLKFVIASICIFSLEWLLCYFLYKRKMFFKV